VALERLTAVPQGQAEPEGAAGPARPTASPGPRAHGLDTLRALAISLVFVYHYRVFVSPAPNTGWIGEVGWVGVDLFFVLSGYLIANGLLAGLVRGRRLSLKGFYARRALRTLPLFWLMLALYFLFPRVMGGNPPPPLWRFLSFTQNIGLPPGTAFSHAWSLCIEEQFYLVLPLVLLLGVRLGAGRRQGWALLAALMMLGVAARSGLWLTYGRESGGQIGGYHPHLYYATLGRFDEFLPGVAVALLKHGHPALWQRITLHGQRLLALSLVATAGLLALVLRGYYIEGYGYGYFMTGFGYALLACGFALWVLTALSPSSALARLRIPGAESLALWSYAIYLSHKAVAFMVQRQWPGLAERSPWLLLLCVTLACLAAGALLHRGVESPFMAWRRRVAPSPFHPEDAMRTQGAALCA
jgi:peptidoglycan/LPS O-acetylase OafA/YrhL